MSPLDRLCPRAGPSLFFSLHSAARQASHPNFHLLGFRASPKFPPSCVISRVAFSRTLEPRQGFEEALSGGPGGNRAAAGQRTPRTKARPQKRKPQKATRKGLPPKGGEGTPQRVCTLGFRVLSSVDGQAYAGCVALSSMGSMATAIRKSTMRCWGPRGPHSTTLQRRHPLLSPRDDVCLCRASSGCWPPRYGWDRPKRAWVGI